MQTVLADATGREIALHEARVRAQAIERVVCADLTHGIPIDGATATYIATMAGQVVRWIELGEHAA